MTDHDGPDIRATAALVDTGRRDSDAPDTAAGAPSPRHHARAPVRPAGHRTTA
ncbi:hypothetical protein ACWCXB_27885 [Streptomyces sp. NPDC001514]